MTRLMLALPLVGLVGACRTSPPPDEGTSVGNPGGVRMSMAPVEGASTSRARLAVAELVWTDCAGSASRATTVNRALDLLALERVEVPAGTWCSLEVVPAAPLELELAGSQGGAAQLSLELGLATVEAGAGFTVDDTVELALELGGAAWLSADELGLESGSEVVLAPGDALHDELAARVRTSTGLFEDDGDGALSEAERAAGPIASAPAEDDDDDDDDDDDED